MLISAGVTSAGPGKLRWNCVCVCVWGGGGGGVMIWVPLDLSH